MALQSVGVHRIHQGDRIFVGNFLNDRQGFVEVALDGDYLGAVEQGLGQFSLGHIAIWDQHEGPHAAAAGVGGRSSRGVARAGADHCFRAGFLGFGNRHGHAPVFKGAGGVEAVVFQIDLDAAADPLGDHRCWDQGCGTLSQGDYGCAI